MKHVSMTKLLSSPLPRWTQYLIAVLAVGLVTLLAIQLKAYLPHTSLLLLFMTGVVMVSSQTSLGPSMLSSFLSFFSFNFFFTEPFFTLDVLHKSDVATLILFLLVTIITGNLASRMRQAISRYETTLKDLNHFYSFSKQMSSALSKEGVLALLQKNIQSLTEQPVSVICKKHKGDYEVIPSHGPAPDKQILDSVWQDESTASTSSQSGWTFFKSLFNGEVMTMVAMKGAETDNFTNRYLTLTELAALALQRMKLMSDLEQTRLLSETEQLRSALLSSVSHDLRTPLASVIGSASTLLELHAQIDQEKQHTLLRSILNESERLDRHIQNLLDMTQFGQGKVSLKRDWVDVQDIISSALNRLDDVLKNRQVSVNIHVQEPIIRIHGLLIEQALVNVIDNAAHFSPENGLITISVSQLSDKMLIDVSDDGPGIPDSEKNKVFDMFYSLNHGDQHQRSGAGLGLAIAQGMVGAHGGMIEALDAYETKGALIRMTLPWTQVQDESAR